MHYYHPKRANFKLFVNYFLLMTRPNNRSSIDGTVSSLVKRINHGYVCQNISLN